MSNKVAEIMHNIIVGKLEEGIVPWHLPWTNADSKPRNMISKKEYRGFNVMMTSPMVSGFSDPNWLTLKQIKGLDLRLKKDQSYTPILFFTWVEKKDGDTYPFMRFYKVFNRRQIEGADELYGEEIESDGNMKPVEAWESKAQLALDAYLSSGGPTLEHGHTGCWYRPGADLVGMVDRSKFDSAPEYWSAMFHEMTHSTGATKRLDRGLRGFKEDQHAYSKEELVAEMGACCMMSDLGVERHIDNSAAYIGGWLKKLKGDKSFLIRAAQQSQKAYDLMKGVEAYETASRKTAA